MKELGFAVLSLLGAGMISGSVVYLIGHEKGKKEGYEQGLEKGIAIGVDACDDVLDEVNMQDARQAIRDFVWESNLTHVESGKEVKIADACKKHHVLEDIDI